MGETFHKLSSLGSIELFELLHEFHWDKTTCISYSISSSDDIDTCLDGTERGNSSFMTWHSNCLLILWQFKAFIGLIPNFVHSASYKGGVESKHI